MVFPKKKRASEPILLSDNRRFCKPNLSKNAKTDGVSKRRLFHFAENSKVYELSNFEQKSPLATDRRRCLRRREQTTIEFIRLCQNSAHFGERFFSRNCRSRLTGIEKTMSAGENGNRKRVVIHPFSFMRKIESHPSCRILRRNRRLRPTGVDAYVGGSKRR